MAVDPRVASSALARVGYLSVAIAYRSCATDTRMNQPPALDFHMPRVTERGSGFRASPAMPRNHRDSKPSSRRNAPRREGEPRGDDVPNLLAAAPIIAVREEMERHVGDLRRLAPASDATSALALYLGKLAKAMEDARDLELFITVDAAAVILGKSPSMVTYLCRTGALQAKKIGGTWQILRKKLEAMQREGETT